MEDSLRAIVTTLPCSLRHIDVMSKRAQLAYLWQNYQYLRLDPHIVSDMMFKPLLSQSQQNIDDSNISMQSSDDWVRIQNHRCIKDKKCNKEKHVVIPTSNRFTALANETHPRQTNLAVKGDSFCIKTNYEGKTKNTIDLKVCRSEKETVKVEFYADSQGRGIPELIGLFSNGKIHVDGLVKPGADIQYVCSQAGKSRTRPLFLLAGTNNITANSTQVIFDKMECELNALSKNRPVCITTIPPRYDVQPDHMIHYNIALANNYIRELVLRMNNVSLIDLDSFQRFHFSRKGIHLNHSGKKKLASMIVDYILKLNTQPNNSITNTESQINCNTINVTETPMRDVIKRFRYDKTVGFAHSISGDLDDPRHMSAGVAVVFKQEFGQPKLSHCLTRHLALQDNANSDYDTAFSDLSQNFKRRDLKHLICSSMGCVRDRVSLTLFLDNVIKFQQCTGATVTIVSYFQKSFRSLRNGLSHEDFNRELKNLIEEKTKTAPTLPALNHPSEIINLESHQPAAVRSPVSLVTLSRNQQESQDRASDVFVAPGDLTFSEALKQSNGVCGESLNQAVPASVCSLNATPQKNCLPPVHRSVT
ncbi:hypothetical protein J6590_030867 [Homalodisca vitripennis]|nr:hypothetical protein J6590_030867 [Homalodisca vitripennis]